MIYLLLLTMIVGGTSNIGDTCTVGGRSGTIIIDPGSPIQETVCAPDCLPGEYYDISKILNGCTQCGVGKSGPISTRTYAQVSGDYHGETKCIQCKLNTFQNIPGSTSCKPCDDGHFQTRRGNSCVKDTMYLLDESPTAFVPCGVGEATDLKIDSEEICFKMWSIYFINAGVYRFGLVDTPGALFPTGCTGFYSSGEGYVFYKPNPLVVPTSGAFPVRTLCSTNDYSGNVICDRTEGNIENPNSCVCGDMKCTLTTGLFCKTDTAGVHGTCSGYENNTAYYFDGEVMSVMDALQHKISYNNLKNCE